MLRGKTSLKVGNFLGVPVRLSWSFFLIFLLVNASLSLGYFPEFIQGGSRIFYWTAGAVTSLLFFALVLAHEFGHALVALHYRIPVTSIHLMVFGGVAQIGFEPGSAREEFQIAIAGPLVSLAGGLGFGLLWLIFRPFPALAVPAEWLARMNLALVAFNLIPGFPLDGGRIFRAVLWSTTRSRLRATRYTGYGSEAIALGFVGVGLFSAFGGNFINAVWLFLIGWYLGSTAASYQDQARIEDLLAHVRVAHLMDRNFVQVPAGLRLADLPAPRSIPEPAPAVLVLENNRLCGILPDRTPNGQDFPSRSPLTAREAMIPVSEQVSIPPDMLILKALDLMEASQMGILPVVQDEAVTGVLTRDRVSQFIHNRH